MRAQTLTSHRITGTSTLLYTPGARESRALVQHMIAHSTIVLPVYGMSSNSSQEITTVRCWGPQRLVGRRPGVGQRACRKSSICSVAGSTGSSRLCHAYGRTSGISASTDDVRTPMLGQKMTTCRSSSTAARQRAHTVAPISHVLPQVCAQGMPSSSVNSTQATSSRYLLLARRVRSDFASEKGGLLLSHNAGQYIVCIQRSVA